MDTSRTFPLISIVVPIYKVEKYLDKCIVSLICQSYKNLEIILVDDGSPDNCGKICDNYKEIDLRIKVIHKANGGLSDARNIGIDMATGKYIAFIDSDDYVTSNYIEKLYNAIQKYNAQVSICSFSLVSESGNYIKTEKITKIEKCIDGRQLLKKVLTPYGSKYVVVWNKLYKTELFKQLRFPKGKLYEDEYINYKLFWNCTCVALIPDDLYFYLQRHGSIQSSNLSLDKLKIKQEFYIERIAYYRKKLAKELYTRSIQMYCNWIINCYIDSFQILDKEYKIEFQKEIRKYTLMILGSKESKIGEKIQNLLAFINLQLACKIKKYYIKHRNR